jgi:ankyrin repeat protein
MQVIELGESFLKEYPNGKYAEFVTRIIDLAQACLNANQRNNAEILRAQVRASLKDSSEDLRVLLGKILNDEAAVDEQSPTGATALMYAATSGDREALRALIHKDASIDAAENTHGWTALIYALWSGNHLIVDDLLQRYPDADIKDKEGRTAFDHARLTADLDILLVMNRWRR